MNLKLLSRVQDLSKEDQTDELKYDVYKMIIPFVRKYQPIYYPSFKGSLEDLASDFFVKFMTPKSRVLGNEESLLDKFDPKITSLTYLVKTAVVRALIDKAREDKGELNYSESYDEETGDLTLDFLQGKLTEEEIESIDEREFDEEFIEDIRAKFRQLPIAQKLDFEEHYDEVKNVLSPNVRELFSYLEGEFESAKGRNMVAEISGKKPNFRVHVIGEDTDDEFPMRAGNLDSLKRKVNAMYPGITFDVVEPAYDQIVATISGKAPAFQVRLDKNGDEEVVDMRARDIESLKKKLNTLYPAVIVNDSIKIKDSCKKFFSRAFLRRLRVSDSLETEMSIVFHPLHQGRS